MRKEIFVEGEYYHIYNRGVDKRTIFSEGYDSTRFLESMRLFNVSNPIGSIFENKFQKTQLGSSAPKLGKLVDFVSYCLIPNHYHFVLSQTAEKGIEKFMHKLGTGYTNYFNEKNGRSGSLFQGRFKAVHITSNEQLLHVVSYVNLNYKVHGLKLNDATRKVIRSSWDEYSNIAKNPFCKKDIILGQFKKFPHYEEFALSTVEETIRRRKEDEELDNIWLE